MLDSEYLLKLGKATLILVMFFAVFFQFLTARADYKKRKKSSDTKR